MSQDKIGFFWLHRDGQADQVARRDDGRWAIFGGPHGLTTCELTELHYRIGHQIGVFPCSLNADRRLLCPEQPPSLKIDNRLGR